MNVTLRQLRAFVAVARTGSFTLAADSLFVTQSALSGLMKELEEAIGLRLVDRQTRRVQLSDVGRDLYPLIEKILLDLDEALTEIENRKSLKTGVVRIAAPQLMAATILPDAIATYHTHHPDIRVKVIDCVVESVVSRVFSGEVDFGVGPEREPNSDIMSTILFERPFVAVFPVDHALAKHQEVSWSSLMQFPFISLQGQFTENLSADLRLRRNINFSPVNEVAFMSTALAMVNAGLGVTACVAYASALIRQHGLAMRTLSDPIISRTFYIFTRAGRSLSPAAQSFHDFLLEYVADIPENS